jgi:predicted DNA-binding transcriptional regulator YafY
MRASRLVSVLLLLQARGRMTAERLAEELDVSERTIYRDLADLGAAGVPVYGERGEGGGYQLIEGYRTNLTGLTEEEAGTLLLTGVQAQAAQLGLGSLLATTRLKLLAAVPEGLREVAARAEQRFLLDPTRWAHAAARDQRHLQTVARAVWQDRQLRVVHDRTGTGRRVDPLALVHKTGTWYLVASYHQRVLVFRVDRIRSASVLDAAAVRPAGFELQSFWSEWEREYAASLPTFVATVRLGPRAQQYRDLLGAAVPRAVDEDPPDGFGWVRQRLTFDSEDVAVAALLALAPEIEVVDPPRLRERVTTTAAAVVQRHTP